MQKEEQKQRRVECKKEKKNHIPQDVHSLKRKIMRCPQKQVSTKKLN